MSEEHPGESTGTKPTNKELQSRVEFAIDLLSNGVRRLGLIKRAFRERADKPSWATLSHRTIARYVTRAQEQIVRASKIDKDVMRGEAMMFYQRVAQDPKVRAADRLRAQENIDALFGLRMPVKHEHEIAGPESGPIQVSSKCVVIELPMEDGQDRMDEAAGAEARRRLLGVPGLSQAAAVGAVGGNGGNGGNGGGV